MQKLHLALALFLTATITHAQEPKPLPTSTPAATKATEPFRDAHFGVRFRVPAGWDFTRKDGLVSTFRLDARSAHATSQLRAVAGLDTNPFPLSTLSGAVFYFSVEPHTTDSDCERQATKYAPPEKNEGLQTTPKDIQNIGGMNFRHGHDEHGGICIEARDEIYTAYRKGSCYRFDLAVNTFCTITSGALELSVNQLEDLESRMTAILSTVAFDWEKSGPQTVPPPVIPVTPAPASTAASPAAL